MPWKLPDINNCCGCVTDLKTAAAIIAVLGIVTSPAISWAAVRHSYVIRVSCFVTASEQRSDVIDINLHNVLSFGFGANAGLGPSCLGRQQKPPPMEPVSHSTPFVEAIKYIGWIVLIADLIFLFSSIHFLTKIFNGPDAAAAKNFMGAASFSIILSFLYGILYVAACISIGGAFPIFEFVFCVVDLLVLFMWLYFILVIRSYLLQQHSTAVHTSTNNNDHSNFSLYRFLKYLLLFPGAKISTNCLTQIKADIDRVWAYFLIVVLSYKRKSSGPRMPTL